MDAHIHLVVVGINDADHLLVTVSRGDTHQSGKTTDTEIHMYDIVARLHLLQFLQRQCHLSGARCITAKAVFMKTVEDLMVGKQTESQGMVNESLVEGLVNGSKRHLLS